MTNLFKIQEAFCQLGDDVFGIRYNIEIWTNFSLCFKFFIFEKLTNFDKLK